MSADSCSQVVIHASSCCSPYPQQLTQLLCGSWHGLQGGCNQGAGDQLPWSKTQCSDRNWTRGDLC